ncbi:SIMPL domain-containing protein [Thalassotalea castellviae]|uniref:SIMPL domain-containing protein n=1 Tax=Thalassotalea castellviae TaxID=3075612 RepID=A0ABU2ZWS5_9GAMM|nr:SIMPL domain-containing protein [Thalassotalea sp. W431]MDT0602115.1 SIMPL domain-containing protein [Thalassotalea sp. W431]
MFKRLVVICLLSVIPNVHAFTGIEVTGKASVMAVPDVFSLTISIKERGKSANKTKMIVDDKSTKIVKMFLKRGVNEDNIDSSQVRLFPIYEKPAITFEQQELHKRLNAQEKILLSGKHSEQENTSRLTRFEVSRTMTISFKQLSLYDQILDDLVKLGVSHISPVEMSIENAEKLYQEALSQAIDKAKQKANSIAQQAGVKLGSLLSLKESGYYSPMRFAMASEAKAGFSSNVSQKAVSAQVIAIYAIED